MKATLEVINQMQVDGVIGSYAIGGAVGATFYLEPVATLDIDIFVSLQQAGALLTVSPIYDYLTARGFKVEKGIRHHRKMAGAVPAAGQRAGGRGAGDGGGDGIGRRAHLGDDGGAFDRHRLANRTRQRFQPDSAIR